MLAHEGLKLHSIMPLPCLNHFLTTTASPPPPGTEFKSFGDCCKSWNVTGKTLGDGSADFRCALAPGRYAAPCYAAMGNLANRQCNVVNDPSACHSGVGVYANQASCCTTAFKSLGFTSCKATPSPSPSPIPKPTAKPSPSPAVATPAAKAGVSPSPAPKTCYRKGNSFPFQTCDKLSTCNGAGGYLEALLGCGFRLPGHRGTAVQRQVAADMLA